MEANPDRNSRRSLGTRTSSVAGMGLFVVLIALPLTASAQEPLNTASATAAAAASATPQSPDGFLFRAPQVSFGLRAGYNFARANSDLFAFAMENLTLNKSDFGAFSIAGNLTFVVDGPFDGELGIGYVSTSRRSEFREFVDENDRPITQRTTFTQVPLTAAVRAYLTPRGRQVGRFAWVPTKFTPYVGAGGGITYFSFRQSGSFVDYVDLSIFDDVIEDSGWAPLGLVMVGGDYTLSPHVALNTDVRYQFSSGSLDPRIFDVNDRIDLNGLQITLGVQFRY